MKLADLASDLIEKLVVLDITPIQYQENHHSEIFKVLFAVQQRKSLHEMKQQKLCVNIFKRKWSSSFF